MAEFCFHGNQYGFPGNYLSTMSLCQVAGRALPARAGFCHHTKADVIAAPLGLIAQPHRGTARPTLLDPSATAPDSRVRSVAVSLPLRTGEVRIGAARQLPVIPVAAPFPDAAMHIMQSPSVCRIAADTHATSQCRTFAGPTVGLLAIDVRLCAAKTIAERCSRDRPCATGVLPLCLRRQANLSIGRQ